MSEIIPFDYEGQPVRIVTVDGEHWFVAADVCRILGIINGPQAVGQLDDDEKLQVSLTISVGYGKTDRDVWAISEPGLYALVLRSDRPEAKPFRRWITHEVLPQLRKTGAYIVDRVLTNRQLAEMVLAEADRADQAESEIAELKPRAALADAISLAAEGKGHSWSVGDAAKLLCGDPSINIGRNKLFDRLVEWGLLYTVPGTGRKEPYQKEITGTHRIVTKTYDPRYDPERDALVDLNPQTRLTWKGLLYVHGKLGGSVPLQRLVDQHEEQRPLWRDDDEDDGLSGALVPA
jgi:anti-repressor protein